MGQATVRISHKTHQALREIARADGESVRAVLQRSVETYRRKRFLEEVNAAYELLRGDAEGWRELESEREAWNGTLGDGLRAW